MITTLLLDFDDTLAIGPQEGYLPKGRLLRFGWNMKEIDAIKKWEKENLEKYIEDKNYHIVKTRDLEVPMWTRYFSEMAKQTGLKNVEKFLKVMLDYRMNKLRYALFDDVYQVIERLSKKFRLCIFTNALPSRKKELQETEIFLFLSSYYIACLRGAYKPNKDFYEIAIEELAAKPEEILFLDDREDFLEPAKELGMRVALMDRKKKFPKSTFQRFENMFEFEKHLELL